MKVTLTVSMPTAEIRKLQACNRLSDGRAYDALKEELHAVLQAHIETLRGEADVPDTP